MAMTMVQVVTPRRALATRGAGWARALAAWLAARAVRPDAVSMAGIAFAGVSALAFPTSSDPGPGGRVAWLLLAASCIQLRLLCNLLDGMLAVEHGMKTPVGDIFNDLPDRLSDVLMLVAAGYASPGSPYGPALGWAAAVTAVLTAYVRVLGGSLGLQQHFVGPMAKQHRMFALTVATLAAAAETSAGWPPRALQIGLAVIATGSMVTVVRRTDRLVAEASGR
jgi:phosphatidylglycerophosphate synthase